MTVPAELTVEHEGRVVTGRTVLEGSVLKVALPDGRVLYEPVRAVPAELQLRHMLRRLAGTDADDPAFRAE